MARGFAAVHPYQEERLRSVGVRDQQVSQGYGYARLSAGSHKPVGEMDGRRYGYAIDLSASYAPTRAHFNALAAAGFAPFWRDWSGNEHWHIVDLAWIKDDAGKVRGHNGVLRGQVASFLATPARDGLRSNRRLSSAWTPTKSQQRFLRDIFENGHPVTQEPTLVKVIRKSTGEVVTTHRMVPGGDHVCDQRKLYVE